MERINSFCNKNKIKIFYGARRTEAVLETHNINVSYSQIALESYNLDLSLSVVEKAFLLHEIGHILTTNYDLPILVDETLAWQYAKELSLYLYGKNIIPEKIIKVCLNSYWSYCEKRTYWQTELE